MLYGMGADTTTDLAINPGGFVPRFPRLHPRYEFWKNHPELFAKMQAKGITPARLFWGQFSNDATPPKIAGVSGIATDHPILFWGAVALLGYYTFFKK